MSKKLRLVVVVVFLYCAFPVWSQDTLPEGSGQKIVQSYCVQCHELGTVTRSGYSEQDWRNNLHMMINVGSALPNDQVDELAKYLAKNFPEKPKPNAVVLPGSVKVSIKEWVVPTPGSRPHDPLATADGAIWYTGQFANVLGRLDPKTGQIKEYRLTPNAGPHGLTADKDGNIWYTANFGSRVGKLNPKTGELTEYRMPNTAARDPHTPIFDQKGNLWFTVQGGNMVGRLNPQTGEVKLVNSPTPKSRPYGIHALNDVLWYSESAVKPNTLVRFDPKTEKFQTWTIPSGGGVVRNMDVTRDGNLALACSGVNRVALVQIK